MANTDIPQWIPILLGGGFVGVATFFVKQITDKKDASINSLKEQIGSQDKQITNLEKLHQKEVQNIRGSFESRISSLERENSRLAEQLQELTNFQNLLENNLEELKRQGITSETNPNVREILRNLKLLKDYSATEKDHRASAKWIRIRKELWLEEMINHVVEKYPEALAEKRDQFAHDLSECLEWFYDSTFYNIPHKFSDYLPDFSVDSIHLYRASFKYLRQKDDVGDLSPTEAEFFYHYLDSLIQLLQD
ncbi:MAG: hypothetical protein HC895_24225 [Leptolyngbyaceae cyanobacterium SM1_3_5]|nr:hypothetical protein [Leptolyngbyaceae cyanobacterium SM1_3_5]